MIMRGNNFTSHSSSGPSRRTSCESSNFKASRQKLAPPRKEHPLIAFSKDIHKLHIDKLVEKLQDTETPEALKCQIIDQIETRQHDEDAVAAAAATAVLVEQFPQQPPEPARASSELIDRLYHKRGPERVKALVDVITLLNQELDRNDLIKHHVVTLLYRSLFGLKKGSSIEIQYSLKVIGLLSIIVDCQDKMSEFYREILEEVSSRCCLRKAGPNTANMLNCLALVTFFGALNSEETQVSMKLIWDFLNPKSDSGCDRKMHSVEVLVAATYAWSFLLTTMEGWRLNQSYWKGAISYFMDLLEHHDDKLVHEAASAALALIYETNNLDKFWNNTEANSSTSTYSQLQRTFRAMIFKKLKGANINPSVLRYFETHRCPEASLPLCEEELVLSTWYQLIQLAFLKSFLGDQFENYMGKEAKLQNIFEYNPYRSQNNGPGEQLYEPTTEKIMVRCFMPERIDPYMMTAEQRKKEKARRINVMEKGKTQLRGKHRLLSQELNSNN